MQDTKKDTYKKEIIFGILLIIAGAVAVYLWLAFFGNRPQVFEDVVIEYTALNGSNKSSERTMVYVLSIIGMVIVFFANLIFNQHSKNIHTISDYKLKDSDYSKMMIIAFAVSVVLNFVFYDNVNIGFLIIVYTIVLLIFHRKCLYNGILFVVSFIYSIYGLYRLYVYFGGKLSFNYLYFTWLILLIIILILKFAKKDYFIKLFLVFQMLIPFTLLIFLTSNYNDNDNVINVSTPFIINLFIWSIIIWFSVLSILKLKKNWNSHNISDAISYGTICCILNFNRYSGTGVIVSDDLHHPFENIIAYSQIIDYNRMPYSDYIPVSGLYSFIQGAFFEWFGKGQFSYYYVTENIFYLVVILLVVFLLIKRLDIRFVFILSLFIPILNYNRVVLIIPIFLLLSWDKLIADKNKWLVTWFLTSLIHGLYYPLFGAALCLGFMPLGLWQIYTYIKSGQIKKEYKSKEFIISWIICLCFFILSIPMLVGTLKHIMAMSKQTVCADGISRFASQIPEGFFSNIKLLWLKLLMYNELTFLNLIMAVCFSMMLAMKVGKVHIQDKKIKILEPVGFCICISMVISMMVAYSYTTIRYDSNIYSRGAGIIYSVCCGFILICDKYLADRRIIISTIIMAIFLISSAGDDGYNNIEEYSKLEAYYSVPEDFEYINDGLIPRLGECFVEKNTYDYLKDSYLIYKNNNDYSYFGIGDFGLFYLCDIKGDSVLEYLTVRGYDAAKESINILKKYNTIVSSDFVLINNYYLYKWLYTSGQYILFAENGAFYPHNGTLTDKEVIENNKKNDIAYDGISIQRIASSLGLSFDRLKDVFEENTTKFNIENYGNGIHLSFEEQIDGKEADYLYIEFENIYNDYQYCLIGGDDLYTYNPENYIEKTLMKKVYNPDCNVFVVCNDDQNMSHYMACGLGQGKLLIPMGCCKGWLLNEHSEIGIYIQKNGENIEVPTVKNMKLLKLREAE